MKYISLVLSEDAAHECVQELGRLAAMQFCDLNPLLTPFQRRYMGYIKRYDELERKLRFVGGEIGAFGLSIMRQASRALARWHCNSLPVQVRGMRSGSGDRSKVQHNFTECS